MKRMMQRMTIGQSAVLLAMALTLGLVSAAPAAAQVRTVKEAAAEYENGVKTGITPVTLGERTMCLGYWLALKSAHEDWPNDTFWSQLPLELSHKAATLYVEGWAGLLVNETKDDPVASEQTNRDVMNAANRAFDKFTSAEKNGGISGYFETLGTCRFSAN